jgi:hypothetical protein
MGWIIGLCAAVVALALLGSLSFFVLIAALISFPAYGTAVGLLILILNLYRMLRIYQLNSQEILATLVIIRYNTERPLCTVNDQRVEQYSRLRVPVLFGTTCGILSIWVILNKIYHSEAMEGASLWGYKIPADDVFIVCLILSLSITAIITYKLLPAFKASFKNRILKQANSLVNSLNNSLGTGLVELRQLEKSIEEISASRLGIFFPVNFQNEIQAFLCAHKTGLLSDAHDLNRMIMQCIDRAKENKKQLEEVTNLYNATISFYTETARAVNRTCSAPLIKELEYDYAGLASANLKSLVADGKWIEYQDVVNSIMGDLARIKELAIKYMEEGWTEETVTREETETGDAKAYRILGIPETATEEQIKRAYKMLASMWHPDAGIKDDTRIKEINWAYDFLKNKKAFA